MAFKLKTDKYNGAAGTVVHGRAPKGRATVQFDDPTLGMKVIRLLRRRHSPNASDWCRPVAIEGKGLYSSRTFVAFIACQD